MVEVPMTDMVEVLKSLEQPGLKNLPPRCLQILQAGSCGFNVRLDCSLAAMQLPRLKSKDRAFAFRSPP
jgi:hypothetical protein